MINFKSIIFAGVILTSCNLDKPKDSGNETVAKTIKEKPAKVIVKTPVSFKGLYQYSKEANILQDCDDPNKKYWINDSLANMSEAYKKATQFLSYPGETVYAEVKGYLAGKAISGDASDYENVLVVTSVNKLDQKSFRTDCYNYEFIALGNEPFWSVDIIPANQKIILKYAGKEKVYEFPYQPANVGGGVHRFETKNSKNDKLIVILREEKCSDGRSDRSYNYSAEIVLNGETLKGCGIKKGDVLD